MDKLIEIVMSKAGVNQITAKRLIKAFFEGIKEVLKKDQEFSVPGFGVWKIKERAARQGRDPRNGAIIQISAKKKITFRARKALKEIL